MRPFFCLDSCLGINGLSSYIRVGAVSAPTAATGGSARALLAAFAVAASASVGGCASYRGLAPVASVQTPDSFAAKKTLANAPVSPAAWPKSDWWRSFADPQLDHLIDEALAASPSLRVAAARTRKALAAADASAASLRPRVDGSASATRQRYSEHGVAAPPLGGSTQTFAQLQATLTFELDFWGKNRSAEEAALGAARAAEVDAYAARLALSTEIARAYVELQRVYLQRDVAEASLGEREQIQALTRDRNAAGIDSRLEVKQAESALPATREQIAEIDDQIALARNRIAALIGAGPDRGLAIERPGASALMGFGLPSTAPAELIGRRPDVVALRWRIESARNDVTSAKAEFYPNVNLLAFAGLQSLGVSSLLKAASGAAGAGPAITLPIFDAGRLRANLAGKDADVDIAIEQYNQALADAMRDVADQVATYRSVAAQRAQQQMAIATAREAYELALLRYREGVGNYLQVLSAEQPMLAQQSLDADLHARERDVLINLVRALGGGYEPPPAATATSAQ